MTPPQTKKLRMSGEQAESETRLPRLTTTVTVGAVTGTTTTTTTTTSAAVAMERIRDRTESMNQRVKDMQVFTEEEVMNVVRSLQNVIPDAGNNNNVVRDKLPALLKEVAHLSHKDWNVTGKNSELFGEIILPDGVTGPARQMLERILREGNWDGAASHSQSATTCAWAVLVTVRIQSTCFGKVSLLLSSLVTKIYADF